MARLRAPGLVPIVGHTTDTTCRIWISAGDPADERTELASERLIVGVMGMVAPGKTMASERRTVGVIGIVAPGKTPKISDAWYFRLHREFDRTGSFVLGQDCHLGWHANDFKEEGKRPPTKLRKGIQSDPLRPD